MPRETCLARIVLLRYVLYFFGLKGLSYEKNGESIVNLFSYSLKLKRYPRDLFFVTLVKMVLKRPLFGISLTLLWTDWTKSKKKNTLALVTRRVLLDMILLFFGPWGLTL